MSGRRARIGRCDRTGKLKYELRPEVTEETLNIKVVTTTCISSYTTYMYHYACLAIVSCDVISDR
jgi:hypothetical protein